MRGLAQGATTRRRRRALSAALVALALLTAHPLPASAHGEGPALYCQAETLDDCTDTGDATTAVDFFDCQGQARGVASCYDRTTGEVSPYCAFHEYDSAKDRDHYMCEGTEPAQVESEPPD